GEALLACEAERTGKRRERRSLVAGKARHIGGGELDGERCEGDVQALGERARRTKLRLGIARIAALGKELRPGGACQAFEQRSPGLRGKRSGAFRFAMGERGVAFEPR